MLSLDQIRLEAARLQGELTHLPLNKFPAIHGTVSARLAALKQGEEAWLVSARAQSTTYQPLPPSYVEENRQRAIEVLKASIGALRGELVHIPAWDSLRRDQAEGAIANYEAQVKELEAQAV